jgi:hypothetical protein
MQSMVAKSPEHAVELLDQAFNAGDLEKVLSFYEDAAVVVTEPGKTARGVSELRSFFERVIRSGGSANSLRQKFSKRMASRCSSHGGISRFPMQIQRLSGELLLRRRSSASSRMENGRS